MRSNRDQADRRSRLSPQLLERFQERIRSGLAALSLNEALDQRASGPDVLPLESPSVRMATESPEPLAWVPASQGVMKSWDALVRTGYREAAIGAVDTELRDQAAKEPELDRLSVGYVCAGLRALGVYGQPGEAHSPDNLVERHGVLPEYRKVLWRWLVMLTEDGLLERRGDTFVSTQPLPERPPETRLTPQERRYYYYSEGLERFLTGKRHPLEEWFMPDGSTDAVETDYVQGPMFRYCNRIAVAIVSEFVRRCPSSRPIRVFEVGAGTGGTTRSILPLFPLDRTTYTYTDISPFFTAAGRRKFGDYGFVRFATFNVELPAKAQGHRTRNADLVVAAHVLHATRLIRETVRNIESLLAPSGLLLLLEETRFRRVFNFGMGFLPGFDRFEDSELRNLHPLLSSSQWGLLLQQEGFARWTNFTEPGSPAEVLGVDVILAESEGVYDPT